MDASPPVLNKGEKLPYTKKPLLGKLTNKLIGLFNAVMCTEVVVVEQTSDSATTAAASRWDISPNRSILTVAIPMITSNGTNTPGWHWTAGQRNYDPATSYGEQQVVYVSPDSSAATSGLMDAGSLSLQKAIPGTYVCLQATSGTIISGTPYYNVPRIPYPTPGNPDDAANFWWMVTPDVQCI